MTSPTWCGVSRAKGRLVYPAMMRLLVAWAVCLVWCLCVGVQAHVPVRVSLRHNWHNYNDGAAHAAPLLEMMEAAGQVWPHAFFSLISRVWNHPAAGTELRDMSYERLFYHMEEVLRSLALDAHDAYPESHLEEWRTLVAQHAQAAKVESYYQMFDAVSNVHTLDVPCDTFVHVAGHAYCTPQAARQAILALNTSSLLLTHDHVHPSHMAPGPAFVLYVDPYSVSVHEFHIVLHDLSVTSHLKYVFRWRPSVASVEPRPMSRYLSGFGTTMHLKKVDYLVLDDRHIDKSHHAELPMSHEPDRVSIVSDQLQNKLHRLLGTKRPSIQDAVRRHSNLTIPEFAQLDMAATHAILSSDDPLSTWESIVLDFPIHSGTLSDYLDSIPEDDAVLETLNDVEERLIAPGITQLWINGLPVPIAELQPLSFIKRMHDELDLIEAFGAPELGISSDGTETIMTSPDINAAFAPIQSEPQIYDASDAIERSSEMGMPVIAWVNDLTSPMYADWPKTLKDMMRYRWMNGVPLIQQNFFQLVVLLDMRDPRALMLLGMYLDATLMDYAIRWGIVPLLEDEDCHILAQLLWLGMEQLATLEIPLFLQKLAATPLTPEGRVNPKEARAVLRSMLPASTREDNELVAFLEGGEYITGYKRLLELAKSYLSRLHTMKRPGSSGVAYFNGQEVSLDEHLLSQVFAATKYQLQMAWDDIRNGYIDDQDRYTRFFYDLRDTKPRRSALVTMVEDAQSFLRPSVYVRFPDVTRQLGEHANPIRDFLYGPGDASVSIRVVGDLNDRATVHILLHALEAMETAPFRLSFVHTGKSDGLLSEWLLQAMHVGALSNMSHKDLYDALTSDHVKASLEILRQAHHIPTTKYSWSQIGLVFSQALHLKQAGPLILLNGHSLDHIQGVSRFDIESVVAWEDKVHVQALLNALDLPDETRDTRAQVIEFAVSVVGSSFAQNSDKQGPKETGSQNRDPSGIYLHNPDLMLRMGPESAPIHITGLLDPLCTNAPQLVSLLRMMSTFSNVRISLMLNPRIRVPYLPFNQFTRFDYRTRPRFDEHGQEDMPSLAFESLPESSVLTMQIHAPRSLVAMADEAVYDLDNIRLADVHGRVDTVYSVNSILVEGHARAEHGPIPEGLQLVLSSDDERSQLDTIVMENLGYFQFRAQPGRWSLRIREGRSQELYEMTSVGTLGWSSPPVSETGAAITLDTLAGIIIFPTFRKNKGKEMEELISGADIAQSPTTTKLPSLLRKAMHNFGQTIRRMRTKGKHADINVFTLASGHLYERMTYIMILSVLRHTKSCVKFWFVENFLSPSFKSFIPHLAQAYHFEYELITYAWPEWLREQTEKQRMIWAYKILFLDVLFPLDLDRVIFVDADQIVRTDLKQLVDMDLHGAPYAYPPMGDDSEDMDGYRFWKQGYWKNVLRGHPYHISALYVVDLKRFRSIAAGNILRVHYQQLTADKNSLANLDQDLPNNLQFLLPIHTLDKTWLWCETWCSHDWLPQAKTIDLCSNPKTKEPKLDRARRQIPEWTELDNEVAAFAESLRAPRRSMPHDEL